MFTEHAPDERSHLVAGPLQQEVLGQGAFQTGVEHRLDRFGHDRTAVAVAGQHDQVRDGRRQADHLAVLDPHQVALQELRAQLDELATKRCVDLLNRGQFRNESGLWKAARLSSEYDAFCLSVPGDLHGQPFSAKLIS